MLGDVLKISPLQICHALTKERARKLEQLEQLGSEALASLDPVWG